MRIRISGKLAKGTLRWAQRLFFASAALLSGYCGFVVADAGMFQRRESRKLERLLEEHRHAGDVPGNLTTFPLRLALQPLLPED